MTVASWLQDELMQLTDVEPATLKKALERYRGGDLRDKRDGPHRDAEPGASSRRRARRLNAMDELEDMVRHQKGPRRQAVVA